MSGNLFVGHLLDDTAIDEPRTSQDIGEAKKRCPLCKKEYQGKDNYCRGDGSRLEEVAGVSSSKARPGRDADSGAFIV